MKLESINISGIWMMIVGTATAIVWMFGNFVSASDFESYIVEDFYEKYYDMEDALEDAEDEDDEDEVRQLKRNMTRLRAKICAIESLWEECDE